MSDTLTADRPRVQAHHVTFEFNPGLGLYRCRCSCGWIGVHQDRDKLNNLAASHDMWEPVE